MPLIRRWATLGRPSPVTSRGRAELSWGPRGRGLLGAGVVRPEVPTAGVLGTGSLGGAGVLGAVGASPTCRVQPARTSRTTDSTATVQAAAVGACPDGRVVWREESVLDGVNMAARSVGDGLVRGGPAAGQGPQVRRLRSSVSRPRVRGEWPWVAWARWAARVRSGGPAGRRPSRPSTAGSVVRRCGARPGTSAAGRSHRPG